MVLMVFIEGIFCYWLRKYEIFNKDISSWIWVNVRLESIYKKKKKQNKILDLADRSIDTGWKAWNSWTVSAIYTCFVLVVLFVSFNLTRHATHVYRNTVAPSSIQCFSGKTIGITYSQCVFCSLRYPACKASSRLYCIFPQFLKKKSATFGLRGGKCGTQNVWFDFLYNFCLKHFSF